MPELLDYILEHEEAFKSKGRLASLYSDFGTQQATNPDGYTANVAAWRKALLDAARVGLVPSSTGAHDNALTLGAGEPLLRELTSKDFGRPLALGAVLQDAVARREMVPLKEFLAGTTSIYARGGWSISPWGVVTWGLRQLGGVLGAGGATNKLVAGEYVVVPNVEAVATTVLAHFAHTTTPLDLITTRAAFSRSFAHALSADRALSQTDISLLLIHLARDRAALAYDPASGTIKLSPHPGAEPPAPISAAETTVAQLRDLLASLATQVSTLDAETATHDAAARAAVARGATAQARAALRKKKAAEATAAKRGASLAQLESVYAAIEDAAGQVAVVRALEAGAGVLRGLHAEVGGAEGVDAVMERVREEVALAEEVTGAMTEGAGTGVVDEEEVEDEFAALEREERERVEAAEARKTAERLAVLEEMEKKREVEAERDMGRLSLDETRPALHGDDEQQQRKEQPLPEA
ncbi:uncharacterized protein K452DRAFT_267860 [Aplosporella prunicola CBS 121167]|uniref:SNF7 family protein n=1 Tax=Aplosporella prunicola CBS 121167 TaxID=1176127 RepID=A0A6A6BI03_9PEZI|nr:uncharacterized protein K452DRAFT_267860 [Aplosporella prunicola CBS 121167]KAF2143626.1 hypothetical protein K452DRAFT_267860 [Aplosporella prunicola CBS 121167]